LVAGLIAVAASAGCAQTERVLPFTLLGDQQQTRLSASASDSGSPSAAPKHKPKPPVAQAKDSCDQPEKCLNRLMLLVESADRSWIKRPEGPAALANGVRLFAYSALKKSLNCGELAAALLEIDGAARAYRKSVAGVSEERLVAARALSGRVGSELHAEAAQRCTHLTSAADN
jgi:hypothetical protein